MKQSDSTDLPYTDTKPQGSADFYFAINATFRFLLQRLGPDGWRRYLEELGHGYYAPVNRQWSQGGLRAVARYWRGFFAAEPDSAVDVVELPDRVELRVRVCPAIRHLRSGGREIVREYCQHCYYLGAARASASRLTMQLSGGDGSCCHTYALPSAGLQPQNMQQIKEVAP